MSVFVCLFTKAMPILCDDPHCVIVFY